jgi:mRNA interferase HigB
VVWILEERTLKRFWKKHREAKGPLAAWIREVEAARWERPADVRAAHRTADFVRDKVIFNIGGNKFRLVVRVKYARPSAKPPLNGIAFILFIGTHEEYDAIDVVDL